MSFSDEYYMRRALVLARSAGNVAYPNPPVGAVVVKNKKIISSGFHNGPTTAHAEALALERAGEAANGSELFVTLEPCNHFGHTPPCVDAILAAKVKRVVVSCSDINPHVTGGGIERLREAGVEVELGVCQELGQELLKPWQTWINHKVPFVLLKLAVSKDGKISNPNLQPRWLSGSVARAQVQRLRARADAILVGRETVVVDNPMLNNRSRAGVDPLKVILASKAQLDVDSNIFSGRKPLVVCSSDAEIDSKKKLQAAGAEIISQQQPGRTDIAALLTELGRRKIVSVLCEGGADVAKSVVSLRLANLIYIYQTSQIVGSGGVSLDGVFSENEQIPGYRLVHKRPVGRDVLLAYKIC